jgi:DNA repair protein RecN (Recombination protein N)
MLEELRIINFAIIDDAEIAFEPGMGVLVGETGAGKTLIVEALGLLSGRRAEFSKLKDETKKALVEGTFSFTEGFLKEHPEIRANLEDGKLTVSRALLPSKAAVCRINGEMVSLAYLKNLMSQVIDIHSQGDTYLLYDEKTHLSLIDAYAAGSSASAGFLEAFKGYQEAYRAYQEAVKAGKAFAEDNDLSQKEFLEYQYQEIEKAHLQPHEIEDLEQELQAMGRYEALEKAYGDLSAYLSAGENGGAEELLDGLISRLRELEGTPLETEGKEALAGALSLENGLSGLKDHYARLDFSPERLEEINQRLFFLSTLQHKYGKTSAEILAQSQKLKEKLDNLASFDDRKRELEAETAARMAELQKQAKRLTSERARAAQGLEKAVDGELSSLGLLEGGFKVSLTEAEAGPTGQDQACFLIQMNKGGKLLPLKEAASGGENSRLSLALKAVFNRLSPYDTLVFDEIDAGISGQIASKAAEKIYEISRNSFVLAVSHLPQVVSRADHVYYVYKDTGSETTSSHLVPIAGKRVVEEVAKMLSGASLTPSALKAAQELIASYKR